MKGLAQPRGERALRALAVLACALAATGCAPPSRDTTFALALAPEASCLGATAIDSVDRLLVTLHADNGALLRSWDLPFDVHGAEASLGDVPRDGRGRFTAVGLGPVCALQETALFEGTSALVTFDPDGDQRVVVSVACASVPPCVESPEETPVFATHQPADLVLGQPDFTTCNGGGLPIAQRFQEPDGIDLGGNVLWVADRGHNRIAAFEGPATLASAAALSFAVGQPNVTATASGDADTALSRPRGVVALADRLLAVDSGNHRGQLFAPVPAANGAAASHALGQNDPDNDNASNAGGGADADTLDTPWGGVVAGVHLFVADTANHRVLRYPLAALGANRPPADLVLGQATFTANDPNRGGAAAADTLAFPAHLATDGTRLWVADAGNGRVLAFDLATLVTGAPAALVLEGFVDPRSVAATAARLVVADSGNHRVLVWEPPPASPDQPPTAVLGQAALAGTTPNADGVTGACPSQDTCSNPGRLPTVRSLSRPGAVHLDGDDLWVSDTCNARVLRFRAAPRS